MSALPTRGYGGTGRNVSVLGLGGAFIDSVSRNDGIAAIDRALELVFDPSGIDFDRPGKHNYDVAFHIDGERLAE